MLTGKGGYLIIPPFGTTEGDEPSKPEYRQVSPNILLPLSAPLRRVITRLLPSDMPDTSCSLGEGEKRELRRLFRGDGDWRTRTTKAARSLRSAEAWLRHRLRVIEGGDPALSAILDPRLLGAERTISCYATISAENFWGRYRAAISPLDATIPARSPPELKHRQYGNRRCPDDGILRSRAAAFQTRAEQAAPALRRARCSDQNPITRRDHHLATMMRCFIAATFGTGQRGIGRLVSFDQIDHDTGFALVVEKSNPAGGYGGARGVYHSRVVRQHLAAYEDYLDGLAAMFARSAPGAAAELAALRASPGLTLFDVGKDGHLVRLKQGELCRAAKALNWVYAPNAGRHWLRSMLIGRVPSDALAAQFGHHLDGIDVWSEHSGLVPQKVAMFLEPAIHQALATVGLHNAPESKRRPSVQSCDPATVSPRNNLRFRAGQVLASAIWNGAMLDRSQERSLINGFQEVMGRSVAPQWIEFDLVERLNQQRWHVDSKTRNLLENYRASGFPVAAGPDRLLAEFLGSDEAAVQFRTAAAARWRFLLPPILFAKVTGALANHSLRDERFEPGRRRWVPDYAERPCRERRETCVALVQCFKGYWREKDALMWRQKKVAHAAMSASLDTKGFYKRMTTLERSLARGLIAGLVADRGRNNTCGYAASTQIERAERLWQHFVPLTRADWEGHAIDELPIDVCMRALPTGPLAADIAGDLVAVLGALPDSAGLKALKDALERHAENYSVNLLHPNEYEELDYDISSAGCSDIRSVITLCYRTGLRFSELRAVFRKRMVNTANGVHVMTLDHDQRSRLKTFYSRRIIPLDVLLSDSEREELDDLAMARDSKLFIENEKAYEKEIKHILRVAAGSSISVFPLRHSFATNALAALLWPDDAKDELARYIDPLLLQRRQALRDRLCGTQSLGAIGPHALAVVMGHTSPRRTLFSYAHHLEVMVAAHVEAITASLPTAAPRSPARRTRRLRRNQVQTWIGDEAYSSQSAA